MAPDDAAVRYILADPKCAGVTEQQAIDFIATIRAVELSRKRDTRAVALKEKKAKGVAHGGTAPIGFKAVRRRGIRRFVPDQCELAVMRRVYELREQGGTLEAITHALRHAGVRSRRGGELPIRAVADRGREYRKLLAAGKLPAAFRPRSGNDGKGRRDAAA